jgi:arylsulfatase
MSRVAFTAFLLAGLDNLLLVAAYDFALASPLERAAAWVFWTAFQGLTSWALASLLGAALVRAPGVIRRGVRQRPPSRPYSGALASGAVLVSAYMAYAMNSFLLEGPRTRLVVADLILLATAAGATLALMQWRTRHGTETEPMHRLAPRSSQLAVATAAAGLLALAASALLVGRDEPSRIPQRPSAAQGLAPAGPLLNVVLVVVDTMRADRLSLLGYPRPTTPNLDRSAASGILFRYTRAGGTQTSPAMASLLTGVSPIVHGIAETRSALPRRLPTLAEALATLGYRNAAFISNPNLSRAFGFTRGFHDVQEGVTSRAEVMVDAARRWLEQAPEPFFLWLHLIDPHAPYTPPPPYNRMFCDDAVYRRQRGTVLSVGSALGGIATWARIGTETSLADYVCAYDGAIRYADDHLGRLLADLDRPPHRDRTLLVVTADHGEALGEHGYFFTHGLTVHEEVARVPLFFAGAGLRPQVVDSPARHIDVPATTLHVATRATTRFGEGTSLLATDDAAVREVVTIAGLPAFRTLAIGDGRHKLVLTPRRWRDADALARLKLRYWPGPHRGTTLRHRAYSRELYDLQNDPGESRSLAGRNSPDEQRLLRMLLRHIDESPATEVQPIDPSAIDEQQRERLRALGYL